MRLCLCAVGALSDVTLLRKGKSRGLFRGKEAQEAKGKRVPVMAVGLVM